MNCLGSLDETYREYSLAPTDDVIRFWGSKVIAGSNGIGAGALNLSSGARFTRKP